MRSNTILTILTISTICTINTFSNNIGICFSNHPMLCSWVNARSNTISAILTSRPLWASSTSFTLYTLNTLVSFVTLITFDTLRTRQISHKSKACNRGISYIKRCIIRVIYSRRNHNKLTNTYIVLISIHQSSRSVSIGNREIFSRNTLWALYTLNTLWTLRTSISFRALRTLYSSISFITLISFISFISF